MAEYTRDGRFHTAYSFELLGPDLSGTHIARTVTEAGAPCWAFSNHDVVRVASRWGAAGNPRRLQMLMALLLSLRGSIVLYQGEELELPHSDVPRHRLRDPEAIRYRPTHAAASLRRNQTATVTFMVSKPWTKFIDPISLPSWTGWNSPCRPTASTSTSGSAAIPSGLGHRRIGHLTTPLRYMYTHLTVQGVREGLEAAGLPYDPQLDVECLLSRKTGEEAVTELFMRGQRPTALICGNDLIAISAMEGLRRAGLRPDEDVALIGCDDIPVSAHVRPALTTFNLDLEALGIRLGQMIVARLGGDTSVRQELIPAPMIIRQSDCPGGGDET